MACVLVIDDDELVGDFIGNALRDAAGHQAVVVSSGKEALAELDKFPVDVIICDIVMNGMDGFEVIGHLRKHSIDVPVIAISGGGQINPQAYLKVATALGVVRTLRKPITINELMNAVAEALPTGT